MRTEFGTTSIWMATTLVPSRQPLAADVQADVCVIGAGIAGMTTAYLLARDGASVVVLDAGQAGSGETARTTAHLVTALDSRYHELEALHGEDGSRRIAASHAGAIDLVEAIVQRERIDCDFARIDGYLVASPGASQNMLLGELAAARRAGLAAVQAVDSLPYDDFEFGPALRFPRQGQFHVLRYLQGLMRAFEAMGGRIHGGTRVVGFDDGEIVRAQTESGRTVAARALVVATDTPVNDRVTLHTKQAAYRTYVIGAQVPSGSVPALLLWDTDDPYHYVRLQRSRANLEADVLIVGGEDHKTGQADDAEERYGRLEEWARERFPRLQEIEYQWSGQVLEPIDRIAFIGRNPGSDNLYVVTGHSGTGMTYGTIAGQLLADLIAGRTNPYAELYDPARKSLRAAETFVKETANMVVQYRDRLTGGDADSVEAIRPATGAILRRGLKKVAVYRDASGNVHELSAVCPHLGCVVRWNDGEKSWDCPCHGSRFAPDGQVLNGPALRGLSPVEED
jgi:glycine/D-amino acid oxidase-like deaminating enzyme/nitrite reductase/ring-hydroxylating ferredoxin subunit